jgi:DNA repair protein RecO (recombination protein O)
MGGSYKAEAVVLRSLRYGEADRVLHLFTAERGRVNAIAKGVRRTRSRVGGRLEPLSHVQLLLHEGRGELHTVSGADTIASHAALRADSYRLSVGQIGAEATLRLFAEPELHAAAFRGLVRFLDLLDAPLTPVDDPALEPVGLAFQLKLLALAGYEPQLGACAACAGPGPFRAYSAAAGGAVCSDCAREDAAFPLAPESLAAMAALIASPLAPRRLGPREAADALRVVRETYAHHGGFRLRTLRP